MSQINVGILKFQVAVMAMTLPVTLARGHYGAGFALTVLIAIGLLLLKLTPKH